MNAKIGRDEEEKKDDETNTFFTDVDKLFDGTDDDKLRNYEMLLNNKEKVYMYYSNSYFLKKILNFECFIQYCEIYQAPLYMYWSYKFVFKFA